MTEGKRRDHGRQGGTLPLVAGFMMVLLGVSALAVDMAMGFASRAEAQRIADSAALAGASAFMEMDADQATPTATARAYEYALKHSIRGEEVDSSEVTIQVLTDSMKVRVGVNRQGLETWFAKLFGIDELDVGAVSAAQVLSAASADCVKPFAVPDAWIEPVFVGDDSDNDNVWETGEEWQWGDDVGERYRKWDITDPDNLQATGYGSDVRSDNPGDQGRQITLKVTDPNSDFSLAPGIFLPFRLPQDDDMAACDSGGGGSDAGAAVYRQNICECNDSGIDLNQEYEVQPGNMAGPTWQGVGELIDEDPDAVWDDTSKRVVNSNAGDAWMTSPRVVKIALFDPSQITGSGMTTITFNNVALFFIEAQQNMKDPITGRFIKYASGNGEGDGSLLLYLRLVE